MPKFNDRLKLLRREAGLSQQDFANQLKISKSSVNMYERGEREPGIETLEAIADYFNVDMDYLLGKSEHRNKAAWLDEIDKSVDLITLREEVKLEHNNIFRIESKKFPLLGSIACGEPIFAEQEFEAYVVAGAGIHADFCLKAQGDSMIGARIYDGDIVFIRKQESVEDGEIAAVLIDDEATLKRVYYDHENNVLQLFAENPQYKTKRFTGEELDHIRILGKAVAFQSDVK
jgi:repressor LexA